MTEEKFELEEEFDSEMKKDRVKLLGQKDDFMQPWLEVRFQSFLATYLQKNGNDRLKNQNVIISELSERIYAKAYYCHIKPKNSRFDQPLKVLYHPYISKADYNFLNQLMLRGSISEMYFSLSAVMLSIVILYATPIGQKIRRNTKLFMAYLGLPPIGGIIIAKYLANKDIKKQVNNRGLIEKYSLQNY